MRDHHLINIMLYSITPCLWPAMAHNKDLGHDPSKWKQKLLSLDFITTKFQEKESNNKCKCAGKKHGLEVQVDLRGEEVENKKKNDEFLSNEVWDKQNILGKCTRCGRSIHQARDWKALQEAKTHAFPTNGNQEPLQNSKKFDKGHLKITEPGSGQDSEKEYRVPWWLIYVFLDRLTSLPLICILQ